MNHSTETEMLFVCTSKEVGVTALPKGRVVHCKKSAYDVYIGRPSAWGNPFAMGTEEDRESVISQYREWIQTQPELLARLPELRGMVLGCFCAPKPCHGDVLVELANKEPSE